MNVHAFDLAPGWEFGHSPDTGEYAVKSPDGVIYPACADRTALLIQLASTADQEIRGAWHVARTMGSAAFFFAEIARESWTHGPDAYGKCVAVFVTVVQHGITWADLDAAVEAHARRTREAN